MSISLNGIIARPDYREDFLSSQNWYSFLDCAREKGALIWGRKTQEKARHYSPKAFEQMHNFEKIVVSTDPGFALEEGFALANSPQEAINKLEEKGCKEALLSGGSILNSSFAKARLIDEVMINIEAVIIGRGIPVFATDDFDVKLQFKEIKQLNDRILQVSYAVVK